MIVYRLSEEDKSREGSFCVCASLPLYTGCWISASPTESITGKVSAISTLIQSPERCLLFPHWVNHRKGVCYFPTEPITGKMSAISTLSQSPERCLLFPHWVSHRKDVFYFPLSQSPERCLLFPHWVSHRKGVYFPTESDTGKMCSSSVTGNIILFPHWINCRKSLSSMFPSVNRKCLITPVNRRKGLSF